MRQDGTAWIVAIEQLFKRLSRPGIGCPDQDHAINIFGAFPCQLRQRAIAESHLQANPHRHSA